MSTPRSIIEDRVGSWIFDAGLMGPYATPLTHWGVCRLRETQWDVEWLTDYAVFRILISAARSLVLKYQT